MFESSNFILLLEDGQSIIGRDSIINKCSTIESSYVVWDPGMMARGLNTIKDSVGTAFNVGIWVFLGITGLYAMISIIRSLFG